MKRLFGGKNLKDSGITNTGIPKGVPDMELVLSISFGVWFVISALFYGYMIRKGKGE